MRLDPAARTRLASMSIFQRQAFARERLGGAADGQTFSERIQIALTAWDALWAVLALALAFAAAGYGKKGKKA